MIRILGVDPGSQRTGIGIIDVSSDGRMRCVHAQPLVLLQADNFPARLKLLVDGLTALVREYQPHEVAIEEVFLSNNAMSALKLGQARGAAIAACVAQDLQVYEYAARQVKLATVGKGSADKKQVQHMVNILLSMSSKLQADAADALAIAITHAHVREQAKRMGLDARIAWGRR